MKHKIYIAMFAAAALALAACDKPAEGYSSFELSTAVKGADGAKTHWTDKGLFWNSGDAVIINGNRHQLSGSGTSWYTSGESTFPKDDGYFYVAYPEGSMSDDGTTVSGIDFSDGTVPLACKGKTNKLTLYPCCAVIKIPDVSIPLNLMLNDGKTTVPVSGSIDVENNLVVGDETTDIITNFVTGGDSYFIIPMESNSMTATLLIYNEDGDVNEVSSNEAVTLNNMTLYVVNPYSE